MAKTEHEGLDALGGDTSKLAKGTLQNFLKLVTERPNEMRKFCM